MSGTAEVQGRACESRDSGREPSFPILKLGPLPLFLGAASHDRDPHGLLSKCLSELNRMARWRDTKLARHLNFVVRFQELSTQSNRRRTRDFGLFRGYRKGLGCGTSSPRGQLLKFPKCFQGHKSNESRCVLISCNPRSRRSPIHRVGRLGPRSGPFPFDCRLAKIRRYGGPPPAAPDLRRSAIERNRPRTGPKSPDPMGRTAAL